LMADARTWLRSKPRSSVDSVFGGAPVSQRRSAHSPTTTSKSQPDDHEPSVSAADDLPLEPPLWQSPRPTAHAGLLFLVPLLTRVGVASLVQDHPDLIERDWPHALLVRLADRLGVSRDDPAIGWIAARTPTIESEDRSITSSAIRDARMRARLDAGRTMRAMIRRPGAIVVTRTHIDVLLRHSQVDVAIRRAGLDLDPGWVPWLGRVVQFHYMASLHVDT
jgi:hypothetical protein